MRSRTQTGDSEDVAGPKPRLTGRVTIPGTSASAAAQMPASLDRNVDGTPSEAAVIAFTVNSDASAPFIVAA